MSNRERNLFMAEIFLAEEENANNDRGKKGQEIEAA